VLRLIYFCLSSPIVVKALQKNQDTYTHRDRGFVLHIQHAFTARDTEHIITQIVLWWYE